MPQTFYITADEEVNSVIGKLRKTPAKRNILVVAQRALILQSSVSLRLIKNEMDNLSKKVMIVTQDEQGLAMAKKIGFVVRKSIEGIKTEEQMAVDKVTVPFVEKNAQVIKQNEGIVEEISGKHNRLKNLGSGKFASVSGVVKRVADNNQNSQTTRIINKKTKKERNTQRSNYGIDNNNNNNNNAETIKTEKRVGENALNDALKLRNEKEADFRDLFVDPREDEIIKKDKKGDTPVAEKTGKILWLFGFSIVVLLAGIAVYFLFPKATITIVPTEIQKNVNLTVRAEENMPADNENKDDDTINLVSGLIEKEETLSLTFKATGDKTSSNQKARGKIIIYNNFSETGQVLVATTRFLTDDNKLFRLIKTITVPGMTVENGKKKPGEIEVGVIADQAGEEYNIESATFTIPGFKGSPKYDKFSAKLNQPMKGGGADGGELRTVAKSDIEKAKKETEQKLKEQIREKMKEEIGKNNVLLTGAIEFKISDSAVFPEEGAVTDNFEYQIKIKAYGLYFSVEDLDKKINDYIDKNIAPQEYSTEVVSVEKKYDKPEVNFEDKTLQVYLNLNVLLRAKIDADKTKQELAGKGQRQIDAFISRHPEIQKIEAEISPPFFANKIPKYINRITVRISNN